MVNLVCFVIVIDVDEEGGKKTGKRKRVHSLMNEELVLGYGVIRYWVLIPSCKLLLTVFFAIVADGVLSLFQMIIKQKE